MKFFGIMFFVFAIVAVSTAQTATATSDPSDLQVVKMSWKAQTRPARDIRPEDNNPAMQKLPGKDQRVVRTTRGERLPVYDQAERASRESDDIWPETGATVRGYEYQATVRNTGQKEIKAVDWQYNFTDSQDQSFVTHHRFQSMTKIAPGKEVKLSKFTTAAPTQVVNAKAVENKRDKPYSEQVMITRIVYTDGSVWERPDQ